MLQKYFWDVESSFFRTVDKEYSSFAKSFFIAKIRLFLINWWVKCMIFLQFPVSFETPNFRGLGIACISWNYLRQNFWVN